MCVEIIIKLNKVQEANCLELPSKGEMKGHFLESAGGLGESYKDLQSSPEPSLQLNDQSIQVKETC